MVIQQLQISPYDPRWTLDFEQEQNRIAAALGEVACRIDRHGSTLLIVGCG
jgi:GrpB-like predicted nucleotidyltransferase (UPF0157 family)